MNDNVSFKAISDAVNSSPVDKFTAGWIFNMVKNRHLNVTHKDYSACRTTASAPSITLLSSSV